MEKVISVGIIGGGVSGAVCALQMAENGIDSILFEKKASVVNGPPFCHLHAGGNLYPDITDEECRVLMKQSIQMAKLFPESIDERPTFFGIPKNTKYEPSKVEERLIMLAQHYQELIKENPSYAVLGAPEDYFRKYSKEDLQALREMPIVKLPQTADEWMRNSLELIDEDQLKMPVFMVQEFGWNMFLLAAQAQLALTRSNQCELKTNTEVHKIIDVRDKNVNHNWEIQTNDQLYKVKYLVNSSGFKTGEFDDQLNLKSKRLIEFKSAYVSKWKELPGAIPEMIFHGERGTPRGMAQLTPWGDNYYQLHGMTKEITLFNDGVIKSDVKAQPEFKKEIQQKIDNNWDLEELKSRTKSAIDYVAQFVPEFDSAQPGGPALFGAQQVVGDDLKLRVGEVSFPSEGYARCEIIKASSALTVANQIIYKLQAEGIVEDGLVEEENNQLLNSIQKSEIIDLAEKLAAERGYPKPLARLSVQKELVH